MAELRLRVEIAGAIATLTLARPAKLNAIDLDMLASLAAACEEVEAAPGVRVAILAAEGKAFSTGGDIAAWAAMGAQDFGHRWVRQGHRVFDRLARLRMPLIAVIAGPALGGGLELAACADIRIAEAQATFGLPEAGLGMVPGWSGTQRLARRFGAQAVRRMALAGDILDAEAALAAGIVERVVPKGKAMSEALGVAGRVAGRGGTAIEAVKLMIAVAEGEAPSSAVETLASIMIAGTADLKEGVAAFRDKRPPRFEGA